MLILSEKLHVKNWLVAQRLVSLSTIYIHLQTNTEFRLLYLLLVLLPPLILPPHQLHLWQYPYTTSTIPYLNQGVWFKTIIGVHTHMGGKHQEVLPFYGFVTKNVFTLEPLLSSMKLQNSWVFFCLFKLEH